MKLKINIAAGIYNIVMSVLSLIAPILILTLGVGEAIATEGESIFATIGVSTIFTVLFSIALILNILALIKSKKNNIKITGHICGIVGSGLYIAFGGFTSIASLVLFILASIWILKQSPKLD